MAVEEHRRIALHRAAAASWGEENADTLVDLVTPAGHEMATKADIRAVLAAMDAMDERWEARFAAMDQRLEAMDQRWDERLTAMDQRLEAMDQRWDERLTAMDQRWDERGVARDDRWVAQLEASEHRLTAAFERGIREAVVAQTRVVVISVLVAVVTMGGLTLSVAS